MEKTPNRIKAKANISESKTLTAMKKSQEQPERKASPRERNNSHGRELLFRNHGGIKEVLSHFSIAENKNFHPRNLYSSVTVFTTEGEIQIFLNEETLRELFTSTPSQRQLLKKDL